LALVVALWALGNIHLKSPLGHHALITNEGPPLHRMMPDIVGHDANGGRISSRRDQDHSEVVVLFLSVGCGPCEELLRVIGRTRRGLIIPPRFLAVLEASHAEARRYVRRYRLDFPVIVDENGRIRADLGIERVPYGFLVDQDGVVRMKGVTNNRQQLEGLIAGRGHYLHAPAWGDGHAAVAPKPPRHGSTDAKEETVRWIV
jgi:hypothetical protein